MAKGQKNLVWLDALIYGCLIVLLGAAFIFFGYVFYNMGMWKETTFNWLAALAALPGLLIVGGLLYFSVRKFRKIRAR